MVQDESMRALDKLRAMIRASVMALVRPVVALRRRDRSRRRLLFACGHELQAHYLAEIWDILKSDSRLDFRLLMPYVERRTGEFDEIRRVLPLQEIHSFWARVGQWDLVVLADHLLADLAASARRRIIRISHGFPGKRVGGQLYAFGPRAHTRNGRIRYTRMFVPSETVKQWAVRMDPAFEDVVTVVGSASDDKMLAKASHRAEYRHRFGFKPDDIVVFAMGTWGPHSLFQQMGDAILTRARELQGQFRFILSVHPIEHRPKPAGERVWGDYVREQSKDGFIIREPWEDWVPYMIASDIILADHTSLALHGVLLGRPFVYCPVPDELVEAGTVIRQIRDISPTIRADASNLRQALLEASDNYPLDKLPEIATQMNSCPHRAADRIREEVYEQLQLPPST